jgi:hypothetical protein
MPGHHKATHLLRWYEGIDTIVTQTLYNFSSMLVIVTDPIVVLARRAATFVPVIVKGGLASPTRTNAILGLRIRTTTAAVARRRWIRQRAECHPASMNVTLRSDNLLRSGVIVNAERAELHC